MNESPADRAFLQIALERRYLDTAQVTHVQQLSQERGLPAEQVVVAERLLSRRRVQRLLSHIRYRTMRRCDKSYAMTALRAGLLERSQLQQALAEQRTRFRQTRQRLRLGTLLISQGLLTDTQDRELRHAIAQPPASSEEAAPPVSDVGCELASELGGVESADGLVSDNGVCPSEISVGPSHTHLHAANAETRIVGEEAPEPPYVPLADALEETPTTGGISIPLDEDEISEVVDEIVQRSTTRYRAIDEAITRIEAIREVQHDLSNSGVFMAKDSAELFERACRARACDRLTADEAAKASPRTGASSAASEAVIEAEAQEAADLEAEELLYELESQIQEAEAKAKPATRWKVAGLKALLGIDAA